MQQTLSKKDISVYVIILIMFLLYSGIYIYKTSFVVEDKRYFTLFDDAMISMRYARNLVEGNGLVMNPGERVEGITNPLWTIFMAAVHLVPFPKEIISIVIQISAALILAVNLFFVMKIALLVSKNISAVSSAAMFLTAFYLPLVNWSLQGMEVSLLTLLISIITWKALIIIKTRRFSPSLYLLLGLATCIRIDMAVPFMGIWFFLIMALSEHRRKNIIWGGLTLMFFLGSQTIFRVLYYEELLPNTYYLKMTGYPFFLRLSRGFVVWWEFIWSMNLLIFLIPVLVLIFAYNHFFGLLAVVFGLQMLYSIYVGGDAWDNLGGSNRYIAIAMPQFFILLSYGLYKVRDVLNGFRGKSFNKAQLFIKKYYFVFLVILCFIELNSNSNPLNLRGLAFLELPSHAANNKTMVERAVLVRKMTTPDARIAVTWAGIIPYFSERYTIDILGKTDKIIARTTMRTAPENENKYTFFHPGHLKYDYRHSIGTMKPDVVLQFWGDIQEANPYIVGNYVKVVVGNLWLYALQNSENVRWDLFSKEISK